MNVELNVEMNVELGSVESEFRFVYMAFKICSRIVWTSLNTCLAQSFPLKEFISLFLSIRVSVSFGL